MSDIINSNKLTSLVIGKPEDETFIFTTARALASRDRIRILRLLVNSSMNIYEISKRLNMPISTVSNHIAVLEEAQIVFVSTQQGVKNHVKMCSKQVNEITFKLYAEKSQQAPTPHTIEMPIGHFTEANVLPPCGMYIIDSKNEKEEMISADTPIDFFSPQRFLAELLWFDHGIISYNFPNTLHKQTISKLELSFELCSEAIYHRLDWPSDICIKINDMAALMFVSPGDFGGRRGKYSSKNWNITSTQFGQFYKIMINEEGVFLNNVLFSKTTIDKFLLPNTPHVKVSFEIKEDAVHRGGLNLFGKNFGDYNQALVLTLYP